MSENYADPDAELRAALERSKQSLLEESVQRNKREKKNKKGIVNRRRLRGTERTGTWTFRCNPDLVDRIRAHVKKHGLSRAVWMEQVLEAALAAETTETNGGSNEGA